MEGRLKLSVFVAPQLKTDEGLPVPTLDQFPDFPGLAGRQGLKFRVLFSNTPPRDATLDGAPPRSDLWKGLFDATTFVRPFEFERLDLRSIRSYPVRHVQSFLRDRYVDLAANSGTDYPLADDLLGDEGFGPIEFPNFPTPTNLAVVIPDREADLVQELEDTLREAKTIPPAGEQQPAMDFLQLKRFHQPRNAPLPQGPHETLEYARPAAEVPKLDFHQVQAALANYPRILRHLGLVFDLTVPLSPNKPPPSGEVQVVVSWTPSEPDGAGFQTRNVSPMTRYTLSSDSFAATPRTVDPNLKSGMLILSDPKKYEVVQLDTDGAAIKALDFAANLIRSRVPEFSSDDTPEEFAVPSLRSGGIAVARVGRATDLHEALLTAKQHNDDAAANQDVMLDAEDLVRGYCVDVWHSATKSWHPLCRRVGTYDFLTANETLVIERMRVGSAPPLRAPPTARPTTCTCRNSCFAGAAGVWRRRDRGWRSTRTAWPRTFKIRHRPNSSFRPTSRPPRARCRACATATHTTCVLAPSTWRATAHRSAIPAPTTSPWPPGRLCSAASSR